MQNQPKFVPQRGTTFFADGRSVRPQVAHTVARGQLDEDSFFYTGLIDGKEADMLPFPVSMQVLARGQERFNIYCTPCHSRVGNGAGMIVQRGYKPAGNFHSARHTGRAAGPLLLRDDQRLRRHAGLLRPAHPGGPLVRGSVYPGTATQPKRQRNPKFLPESRYRI